MNIQEIITAAKENQQVSVFVDEQIPYTSSRKGVVTNIRLSGCKGIGVRFEGVDYDVWFHEKKDSDKRRRYMDSLSFYENKEQLWMNKIESNNVWDIYKKHFPEKSYNDICKDAAACKLIYDEFWASLPKSRKIINTNDINIGDRLMYTMNPRGTGMYIPKIGEIWEMKTDNDIIGASIELIERGRGWQLVIE